MSVHFQNLMALSASHTKESENAVQHALAERQRKERERRKLQEEQERKERERERQLRLKHFEDQKKEQEKIQRQQQEQERHQAFMQRKEEERMDKLLGKRKPEAGGKEPKWPTSASQERTKEELRKKRLPTGDVGDDESAGFNFLTREEKRKHKAEMERRRLYGSTKRSHHSGSTSFSKLGRRLPGGAVDITATSGVQLDDTQPGSVKQRLAKQPMVLTKLNQVKRDTRTIDEIVRDRAKLKDKVLDGEEAKQFDDWFGVKKKEKDITQPSASPGTQSLPVSRTNSPASRSTPTAVSASSSHAASGTLKAPIPKPHGASMFLKTNGAAKSNLTGRSSPNVNGSSATSKPIAMASSSRGGLPTPVARSSASGSASGSTKAKAGQVNAKYTPSGSVRMGSLSSSALLGYASSKKRSRSESRSQSPVPTKKRAHDRDRDGYGSRYRDSHQEDLPIDLRGEIWGLFGKNRRQYVEKDIFSDDEDMEADASDLEKEEKISGRIARREDALAEAEEKRREEEKRRRRKEKEAAARRGY